MTTLLGKKYTANNDADAGIDTCDDHDDHHNRCHEVADDDFKVDDDGGGGGDNLEKGCVWQSK